MIDKGQTKIPEFQRDFRWEIGDVIELLISIMRGFPTGVLLFWDVRETKDRLAERPFEGVDPSQNNRTVYQVLDGQQRLTSLYQLFHTEYVMLKGGRRRKFYLKLEKLRSKNFDDSIEYYSESDVRRQKLDVTDTQIARDLLPINILTDHDKLRQWKTSYALFQLKDKAEPSKIAEQLPTLMNKFDGDFLDKGKPIANLLGYFYHYIELPSNLSMEAVTTIFEKLNTTGQPLNIFEILTAKFYGKINLREIWHDTKKKHFLISKFTKDEKDTTLAILILKAILLKKSIDDPKSFSTLECKRKNLLEDVVPLDIKSYWDDILSSFERSLSKLSDEYGTPSLDFLPYTTMLVPFSVIVNFVENKLHVSQKGSAYRKLESWYWSSVLSGVYDSATDTRSKTDVGQLIEWIKGGGVPSIVDGFDVKSINFDEIADGAKYKGILNLIIKNGCSDLCTGELVSTLIKNSPKNVDVHHVFPVKFLERRYGDKSEQFKKKDIVLNKTIVGDETNRTYIKDDPPSVYLAGIARVNPKVDEVLKNHLLLIASLKADDFDGFLDERKDAITTKIKELTRVS